MLDKYLQETDLKILKVKVLPVKIEKFHLFLQQFIYLFTIVTKIMMCTRIAASILIPLLIQRLIETVS